MKRAGRGGIQVVREWRWKPRTMEYVWYRDAEQGTGCCCLGENDKSTIDKHIRQPMQ